VINNGPELRPRGLSPLAIADIGVAMTPVSPSGRLLLST